MVWVQFLLKRFCRISSAVDSGSHSLIVRQNQVSALFWQKTNKQRRSVNLTFPNLSNFRNWSEIILWNAKKNSGIFMSINIVTAHTDWNSSRFWIFFLNNRMILIEFSITFTYSYMTLFAISYDSKARKS